MATAALHTLDRSSHTMPHVRECRRGPASDLARSTNVVGLVLLPLQSRNNEVLLSVSPA